MMYRNNFYTYCFTGGLLLSGTCVYVLNDQRKVDLNKLKTLHNELVFLHYTLYALLLAGVYMMIWAALKWYKKVYKINQLYR